jgi:hypothetical protein
MASRMGITFSAADAFSVYIYQRLQPVPAGLSGHDGKRYPWQYKVAV